MPLNANEYVVQTVNLTKVFRDFWRRPKVRAVDQLTLEVHRGEVFGLLGPNGSGKSTTIKLLLGLLFPTSGAVRVLGRPPRDVSVKARLGFLPEETYLYPYLNAAETLEFFGRLSGLSRPERRRRVGALIEMVGLGHVRNRPLREYSKGMARRIGLAQALVNDPELLLLDEPTTGLDPLGAREVKDLILELKRRGKTILLCSHLLAHAEDVCDRIGILYGGRLCVAGSVGDLLARSQLTQVTLPALPPHDTDRLRALLEGFADPSAITIGHPVDRLESFFLRAIEEARQARPATTGAVAGHFEPSLFRTLEPPSPADVIERLTHPSPATAAEPPAPPEQPAPPPETRQDVIERLAVAQQAPPSPQRPAEPAAPVAPPSEAAEADGRSVIERLAHKPKHGGQDQGSS
ncbi:MAG TPA: ABC transporter ATP-binding protein [Planctomycetota bacterium]|nr:ABC transporter ATP-binding protein [Planctomycetota bacterium]